MKRLLSLALAAAMTLALIPAAHAASGVTTGSGVASGSQLVYVDMTGRTGDVVIGSDGLHTDTAASSMVTGSVAAINGGFFNSYYSGAGNIFPSNCAEVYGALVRDGQVLHAGDANNVIGFTYDGKVAIDRVTIQTTAVISGKGTATVWGVNKLYNDSTGIMLMTDDLKLAYTVPTSSKVFTIKDDKVVSVNGGGTYTTPAGCSVLIYNSGAVANVSQWNSLPAVGDTIRFAYNYTATRTADQAMWDNMKTIVTGGRMLVQNKQNVTANSSYNSQYDSDPKQSNTSSSLRSFAAVMGDGRLLLGTASGTFPQIANDLIALGAVHAISLDGGASSMLYADGSGFLTPAGRELAVVLTIVPQDPNEKPYENPESGGSGSNAIDPGVADPHTPSSWAAADVEKARSLGLIPSWLTYGYKGPITRAEFAATVLQLFPACLGKSADTIRDEMGIYGDEFASYKFSDYDNYNVQLAAALGIVTGYEDGTFRPNNSITREQAAIMIQRAVKLLGTVTPTKNPTFTDAAKVSPWAAEGVQFVTSCGIMNGSNNTFNPQGTYTREQTYITMLNVYNAIKGS